MLSNERKTGGDFYLNLIFHIISSLVEKVLKNYLTHTVSYLG